MFFIKCDTSLAGRWCLAILTFKMRLAGICPNLAKLLPSGDAQPVADSLSVSVTNDVPSVDESVMTATVFPLSPSIVSVSLNNTKSDSP